MSIIVRAADDTSDRKDTRKHGEQLAHMMNMHKKSGDHIEVTEAIAVGTYTLHFSETADGFMQMDLVPGTVP